MNCLIIYYLNQIEISAFFTLWSWVILILNLMKKEPNLGKFNNIRDTIRHLVFQIRKPMRTNKYHQGKKIHRENMQSKKNIFKSVYIYI